uniref:Tegument protein VP11/12 n=1 Tax=Human herpesvirus 2 TaxID=10310 RepID=A0A1U9ZIV7_HHV2|nr:tegument protein VP11/12 [Human alphaherpesvirus 2]
MQRRARGASSLRLARCLTPANLIRGANAGVPERRIFAGCLLPTPEGLLSAAVGVLRQRADDLQPAFLTGADRSVRLAARHHNTVPESLIVDGLASDPHYDYIRHYASAAKQALGEVELSGGQLSRAILAQYWKYLQTVVPSGLDIPDDPAGDCDPSLHVLLRPTLLPKLLVRAPFKSGAAAAKYAAAVAGLRDAAHRLQQYMFFMRPADPSRPSTDTALRLSELLAYVSVLYHWASWMLWTADKYVCRRLGPADRRFVALSGSLEAPAETFARHLDRGPSGTTGSMQCMALRAAVSDVLGHLTRLAHLWETGKRSGGTYGIVDAIVSTVEVLSIVHHHAQYIINATLTGYVVWASDSLNNEYLRAAVDSQERFCRTAAPLFPTMTAPSWARMELSIKSWFGAALAPDLLRSGTPSPHYESILRLAASGPPGGRGAVGGSCRDKIQRTRRDNAPPPLPRARPHSTPAAPRRFRRHREGLPEPPHVDAADRGPEPCAGRPATYYTHMAGAPPRLPPRNPAPPEQRPAAAARPLAAQREAAGVYDAVRTWGPDAEAEPDQMENTYLLPDDDAAMPAGVGLGATPAADTTAAAAWPAKSHAPRAPSEDADSIYESVGEDGGRVYEEIPWVRVYENICLRRQDAGGAAPPGDAPDSPYIEAENPLYDWGGSALFSPPGATRAPDPGLSLSPMPARPRTNALANDGPTNVAALSALLTKLKRGRHQSH